MVGGRQVAHQLGRKEKGRKQVGIQADLSGANWKAVQSLGPARETEEGREERKRGS